MARGKNAKVGDTRWSDNGYHYTRCEEGWRLTHHLVAERMLGRRLAKGERVKFVDGNPKNFAKDNIAVTKMGSGSLRRRKAQLEARIEELQAELHEVETEISKL